MIFPGISARIYALLAAVVAGGAWLVVKLRLARVAGSNEALRGVKDDDYEAAADIRTTVRRDLPDRVRELDGAGWRD